MRILPAFLAALAAAAAADFPQAEISSAGVKARLYLPDSKNGYYRATRFDWAGVIPSLEYKGRQFFGQWFPRYDPMLHDSIVGPVESFDAIGYDKVKPGGSFLRIGVGVLRRADDKPLNNFTTFEVVDGGKWTSRPAADRVEMTHDLRGVYLYTKTVSLAKDKPMLILDHTLKNVGKQVLETDVYNHDFFMLGGLPTGPNLTVQFPFEPRVRLRGPAAGRGKQFVFTRELAGQDTVMAEFQGFGATAKDYDIRVENRRAKAGVRQTSDHALAKLSLWSIRTTVCPEAYTHVRVEPGQEFRWRVAFEFYTLD